MEHKITIRLSDKEYDLVKLMSKYYQNNISKAIREMILSYGHMATYLTSNRKILEEYNQMKDDLPFT